MDAAEVRMLDNQYALLFIRGERPIQDFKYDILKHPNVKLSADGGAPVYQHGEDRLSFASFAFDEETIKKAKESPVDENEYLFFSDEEFEELINKKMEETSNEQKQTKHKPDSAGKG